MGLTCSRECAGEVSGSVSSIGTDIYPIKHQVILVNCPNNLAASAIHTSPRAIKCVKSIVDRLAVRKWCYLERGTNVSVRNSIVVEICRVVLYNDRAGLNNSKNQ